MLIIILLINFSLIYLTQGILMGHKINIKEIVLSSVLSFSALLVLITEVTSMFHLLNFQFILLSWVSITLMNFLYLLSRRKKLLVFIKIQKQSIIINFKKLNKYEKYLIFSVIILISFVFIQGVVYPPNNWDSMTYHLARIPNWISHQSVEHYQSHIFRQIFQPPFAEFVIMHFNILNNGDYFANSVQFFFMFFSIFAVVAIVEQFGLSYKYKLIAIILIVTIPEVILQASSTQNDVVVSFFILTTLYYSIKSYKTLNISNFLYLGLSVGIGVLTKGTAYIYLAPILLFFAIRITTDIIRTKNFIYFRNIIILIFAFIAINSGHYIRNYNLSNNILGINNLQTPTKDFNENMNILLFLSNLTKNVGLHCGPYPVNQLTYKVIYKLHSIANIDCEATNFMGWSFRVPNIPTHEDNASNPIHLLLLLLSFIFIGSNFVYNKRLGSEIIIYIVMIILQATLFCLIFKFTLWHTRLQTPLFMLSVPIICYAISLNEIYINFFYRVIPLIFFYAFCIMFFNFSRPVITFSHPFRIGQFTSSISLFDSRYKKYFSNRPEFYLEYNEIQKSMSSMKKRNIGIIIGNDDWEYPLFANFYGLDYNPIHINVSNITKNIPIKLKNIDCIISTTLKDSTISFYGKIYNNMSIKNKFIWIYK